MDTRQQKKKKASADEWYTPQWIIEELGPFDLDPCAAPCSLRPFRTAPVCYTKEDDGLLPVFTQADAIVIPFEYEDICLEATTDFVNLLNTIKQKVGGSAKYIFVPNKLQSSFEQYQKVNCRISFWRI